MTEINTWRRVTVELPGGSAAFFEPRQIYYLVTEGHDTLVRTARRKPYRSSKRLGDLARGLPTPPFFRCHSSYVVNLAHVRALEARSGSDYALRLDPPVNKLIPLARGKLAAFRKLMGAP